jgi:hypothetical protein
MSAQIDEEDWELTSDGLYVARREFLIRRGYCCANMCRNCPYINWRNQPEWQPIPAESVKRTRVASRSAVAAQALLHHHEQLLETCEWSERARHKQMIQHYTHLLAQWEAKKASDFTHDRQNLPQL